MPDLLLERQLIQPLSHEQGSSAKSEKFAEFEITTHTEPLQTGKIHYLAPSELLSTEQSTLIDCHIFHRDYTILDRFEHVTLNFISEPFAIHG